MAWTSLRSASHPGVRLRKENNKMSSKIRITEIPFEAISLIWKRKGVLLQALLPAIFVAIAIVVIAHFFSDSESSALVKGIIYTLALIFITLVAVPIHKLVILGDNADLKFRISAIERKYALFFLGFWLTFGGLLFFAFSINSLLGNQRPAGLLGPQFFLLIAVSIGAVYSFSRLSILFPTIAVENRFDIKWAWEITRSNGWRMAVFLFVYPFLFGIVESLTGLVQVELLQFVLSTFLTFVTLILETAVISISYIQLTGKISEQ